MVCLNASDKQLYVEAMFIGFQKDLQPFVAEESIDQIANRIIDHNTLLEEWDHPIRFRPSDVWSGFTIHEHTDEMLEIETKTINIGDFYDTGWKNNWSLVLEDNEWKISQHEFNFPEHEGSDNVNTTFEDIQYTYFYYDFDQEAYELEEFPLKFVEEYEGNYGYRYIVVEVEPWGKDYYQMLQGEYSVFSVDFGFEHKYETMNYNEK